MRACEDLRGHAALVLVACEGRVLAISRGHDVWDWGLPGGGAEPGIDCTIADTAFRELEEETGVLAGQILEIDDRRNGMHHVTTFYAESIDAWPRVLRSDPFEGHVDWVAPDILVAPTCRYRHHQRIILEMAGLL